MNTRLVIVLSSFAIIAVGVVALMFFNGEQPLQQEVAPGAEFPVAGPSIPQTQDTGVAVPTSKLVLQSEGGGVVVAEDFLKDPNTVADPINVGYYNLNYATQATSSGSTATPLPYFITYISSTQYFNVELLEEPIGQARELAQQYLQRLIGISESDMCRINYTVSTPYSVSGLYGGASLGFSFCPGATILPK